MIKVKTAKEEAQNEKFMDIASAITSEEETIAHYNALKEKYPETAKVFDDIIAEEQKHIGQLRVLMNYTYENLSTNIEEGKREAEQQLDEAVNG